MTRLRARRLVLSLLAVCALACAQTTPPDNASQPGSSQSEPSQPEAETGPSTDLFVMFGSDFDRPGLDWSPFLRQTVKTHFSVNGELSHGIVTQAVHAGI